MGFFGKGKRVKPEDVSVDPGLRPNDDPTFDLLFGQAMKGITPVYFGAVPLELCIPADPDYRPDTHPIGAQAIEATFQEGASGNFSNLIVYPRGRWFVVSDDYIPLFAYLRGSPDYVPCWILGKPDNELVKDLQGPIAPTDLPKAFGLG